MGSRPPNTLGWIDGGPGPRVEEARPAQQYYVRRLQLTGCTETGDGVGKGSSSSSSRCVIMRCAVSAGRRAPHHHTGRPSLRACPVPGQHLKSSDDSCHSPTPALATPTPSAHKPQGARSARPCAAGLPHARTHPAASAEKKTMVAYLGDEKKIMRSKQAVSSTVSLLHVQYRPGRNSATRH